MSEEKTVGECFEYNKATRLMIDKVEERHDEEIKDIKGNLIPHLVNRLPIWATLLISILTAVIGILAGVVAK